MANLTPILLSEDEAYLNSGNIKELIAAQTQAVVNTSHTLPETKLSNIYENLKVYGFVADNSACGYYRVINPLQMLKLHGANVTYSSICNFWDMHDADVILVPRQYGPEIYELVKDSLWEGKIPIYECDDNLEAVLPSSPAYTVYYPGSPAAKMVPKFVRNCLGMTTTTPECARWYHQYNRNTVIIENFIDFHFRNWGTEVDWVDGVPTFNPKPIPKPACWEGKTVLGWAGGSTHAADLLEIGPPVKAALQKYPELVFAFYGSVDNALNFAHQNQLPLDRVYRIPARHFLDYPEGLFGIDIGLAPIVPCEFNASKSSLRCLEYLTAEIATIATNFVPYARFANRHPGSILTVGNGKNSYGTWLDAISFLVENPEEMQRRKTEGRKIVLDNYSLEMNYHRWPQAWHAIANEVNNSSVGPPTNLKPRAFYKSAKEYNPNNECGCGSGRKSRSCCGSAWSI